jgi:hypothetical protein
MSQRDVKDTVAAVARRELDLSAREGIVSRATARRVA